MIGSSPANPAELIVADLRTMETQPLSGVSDFDPPAGSILMVSNAADDGTIAVGFGSAGFGSMPYSLLTDTGAAGDLLLLRESFDDISWVSVPDSPSRITGFSLSSDASHLAVTRTGTDEVVPASYSYALLELPAGTEVASSTDIPNQGEPAFTWVQGGTAIAFINGATVQVLSADGNGEPTVVFEAPSPLFLIQTTWDPDVVVVTEMDSMTRGASSGASVYSVNVATSDVLEFAGIDASANASWFTDAGALVMYQPAETPGDTLSYAVFDPVTGDQIGEILDAPSVQVSPRTLPTLGPDSVSFSQDGTVEVMALGTQNIYSFIVGSDGMTIQRIDSPDGLLAELFLTANVMVSPDGTMLALNGQEDEGRSRYLISLVDPAAGWQEWVNNVPGERGRGLITFVKAATD